MNTRTVLFLVACLAVSGCDDSKNPLSDPKTSKADERLIGVWLDRTSDGDVYYHVGHRGGFPRSVLWVVEIRHHKGRIESPEEYLIFPTVIGNKTYLNMILDGDTGQVKRLKEKGWKAEAVDNYTFFRYEFDGDKLTVWVIDERAKAQAIQSGKVNGVIGKGNLAQFTDTTENVARFVGEAGDSLWDTKGPGRFERVGSAKKP
jgi:hypothetical protein